MSDRSQLTTEQPFRSTFLCHLEPEHRQGFEAFGGLVESAMLDALPARLVEPFTLVQARTLLEDLTALSVHAGEALETWSSSRGGTGPYLQRAMAEAFTAIEHAVGSSRRGSKGSAMTTSDRARALAMLRTYRGTTQERLARCSGVSKATISQYERGRAEIGHANLAAVLGALEVPGRAWESTVRHIAWLDHLSASRAAAETERSLARLFRLLLVLFRKGGSR